MQQGLEAASHTMSMISKERSMNSTAQFTFSILCSLGFLPGKVPPTVKIGLPTSVHVIDGIPHRHAQVKQSLPSQMCLSTCLLGDSRPCQVDIKTITTLVRQPQNPSQVWNFRGQETEVRMALFPSRCMPYRVTLQVRMILLRIISCC